MTTPASASWVRPATSGDWENIARLLSERHLPTEGARDHLATFVVAAEGPSVLGCAGIEQYGDLGLLRSVAVAENAGGRGVGAALMRALLERARALGLRELYLLTTSATAYFPRFGFERIGREALPSSLQSSEEMRGACPASAAAMRLIL